jgi:PAS domain S-box-containing protein
MPKRKPTAPPRFSNLYQFIRLILGATVPDRWIARRWDMDVKNFHDFKVGKHPVPRVERLSSLAKILRVSDHFVYEVAKGTPSQRVYHMIKKLHLKGRIDPAPRIFGQAYKTLKESEQRYKKLFHQAGDAIFVADTITGVLIDCNEKAEELIRRPRKEIIGMSFIKLHPPAKQDFYRSFFKDHVRQGAVSELRPAEVIRKDGKIIPVLISARVMELDGRSVIQGIFRDASRLKLKS